MKRSAAVTVLAMAVTLTACYHAIIDTGLTPSPTETIEQPWANSFVYGLVPPNPIDAMDECTSGVAKVETKHSFLNGLVGALTLGIYTPMTIIVTCSASGEGSSADAAPVIETDANASAEVKRDALRDAARLSAQIDGPVLIKLTTQ